MVIRASRNICVGLVLIVGMTQKYVDGRKTVIFFKDRINSWREATTVNEVNNLKSATPSSSEGRFCALSKTVS